jgi:nitroreductase
VRRDFCNLVELLSCSISRISRSTRARGYGDGLARVLLFSSSILKQVMSGKADSPLDQVKSLIRVRQVRQFTEERLLPDEIEAITEVARWSGSSGNQQPCRFIVVRQLITLRHIAEIGLPLTRSLQSATAAIAIALPNNPGHISYAYDEGRAAERMITAASFLGLGAAIAWIRPDVHERVHQIIALPNDRMVRTFIALGHPTLAARRPRLALGEARLSRDEIIFDEHWLGN